MTVKKQRMLILFFVGISGGVSAEPESHSGTIVAELKHFHISSAYSESKAPGIQLKGVLAEPVIGFSVDFTSTVLAHTGLLKPNDDLIFINSLEQE